MPLQRKQNQNSANGGCWTLYSTKKAWVLLSSKGSALTQTAIKNGLLAQ